MKRKFFSALLLMTLSVASVGMFVSCKDYDDDINGVRDDVTSLRGELENAKSDLNDQLTQAKGDFAAQIQDAIAGKADADKVASLELSLAAKEKALQAQIDAINEALDGLSDGDLANALATLASVTGRMDNVEDKVAAAEKNLEIQTNALNALIEAIENSDYKDVNGLLAAVKSAEASISEIRGLVSSNGGNIDELRGRMEDAEKELSSLNASVAGLQGQIDVLNVLIEKMLSSLVFSPDFYYGGIEAMEATTIDYTPIELNNNSPASAPLQKGETWKHASSVSHLTPDIVAYYHMNPSYFDVSKIKSMSVVSDDKDYIQLGSTTRTAASGPSVVDKSWLNSKDGKLSVKLNLDASKLAASTDKVTVLAVQAHFNDKEGNDTTVTSDYAAVAKSTITDIVIADKTVDDKNSDCSCNDKFHVYTTAEDAIDNDYTHSLVYDDKVGVDLLSLVQMHFKRNAKTTEDGTDDVAKYGMKWEFALSHYYSGSNKTSESAHAYVNNDKLIACTVDENGNSQQGVQDRSSLGREPMVRVVLKDTVNNKNVAVGFIKFKISEKEPEEQPDINIDFNNPNGVELSCDDFKYTQTWSQVENLVLSQLNLSKEEFEDLYEVEKLTTTTGETRCQLYTRSESGTPSKSTQYGEINEKRSDNEEDLHTVVLEWVVGEDELYNVVWDNNKHSYKTGQSITTGVRFKSNDTYRPDVYVWFNSGVITVPTAKWSNTNKISNNWASKNSNMGSGYDEIHNNVEVVGQTNANDEFNNDILSTLVGNKVTLDVTGSSAFSNSNLTFEFRFVIGDYKTLTGQSGAEYTMGVADGGNTLTATYKGHTEEIAKLSKQAGGAYGNEVKSKMDINSVVSYLKSDYALDILNAASHTDLANTATATVGIYASNQCGMQLPIEGNLFDIKFLRPVDAKGAEGKVFTDAIDGGNKIDMAALVEFSDWRDQWYLSPYNYVAYYNISAITADKNNITTTLNGGTLGETKLSSITDAVKFDQVASGANSYGGKDFGCLRYENNGQVTSQFVIRVPLTITYDWGEISKNVYVDITVEPTKANRMLKR